MEQGPVPGGLGAWTGGKARAQWRAHVCPVARSTGSRSSLSEIGQKKTSGAPASTAAWSKSFPGAPAHKHLLLKAQHTAAHLLDGFQRQQSCTLASSSACAEKAVLQRVTHALPGCPSAQTRQCPTAIAEPAAVHTSCLRKHTGRREASAQIHAQARALHMPLVRHTCSSP